MEMFHLPNSLKSLVQIIFYVKLPHPFLSFYTAIKGNLNPKSQRHQGPLIIQI